MSQNQLTVTYLYHSGFMMSMSKTLFVFDYWQGESTALPVKARISEKDFEHYDAVYVFVSHSHPDHFDEVIYTWDQKKYNIQYIVSDDIPVGKKGKRMHVGETLSFDTFDVTAYDSTDLGVSFYLHFESVNVFFAGDLNLWHWRDESTLRQVLEAEKAFYKACDPLVSLPIDLAFFPLDPRLGGMFDSGMNHFIMSVKPRLVIPMHFQNRPEVVFEYARKGRTKYTEILSMTKPRERADLQFLENELKIHLHTPVQGLYDDVTEKEEDTLQKFDKNDPFSDTDLPVQLGEN